MQALTFLFDYAEVLSHAARPDDLASMPAVVGLPPHELEGRYWRHRLPYDLGGRAADFWSDVTGTDMSDPSRDKQLQLLIRLDIAAWARLDDASVQVVADLRERSVPLVLLSNLPHELACAVRTGPLSSLFDSMVFSSDLGLAKPDPAIFDRVLHDLGLPAQAVVFVDDRAENLVAAAGVGIHAVPFDGSHRLAEQVSRWTRPRAITSVR